MATVERSEARGAAGENPKGRTTRATLVAQAVELFAEQGYLPTSIRDVARRASVTTGAIYGHFRNKADLLVEAINTCMDEELESRSRALGGSRPDYVDVLTRLARDYPKRRRLRALILQGAAAAQSDAAMSEQLRREQLEHLRNWVGAYELRRAEQGIDASVDIEAMVLYTWAVELGLGVLEAFGIEPPSRRSWADVHNRMARGMKLPPES